MHTRGRSSDLREDTERIEMRGYEEIKAEVERLRLDMEMNISPTLKVAENARMWALKWVLREE